MYANRPNTDMENPAALLWHIPVPPPYHFVPRKVQIFKEQDLKKTHKTHKIESRIAHCDMGNELGALSAGKDPAALSLLRHTTIEKENGL